MTQRTDIHRPVEMDPENYEYVCAFDNGAPGFLVNVDMEWWASITNWPTATRDRSIHQCHHCGARIRYFAILKHTPSGEHIAVGETCLDNRFSLVSKAEFDRLRKAAALDRQAQRIKTAAREFVAGLSGDAAVALDRETNLTEAFGIAEGTYAFRTILDIRRKLWNSYGSCSERQVGFVLKLIAENAEKVVRQAQIAAEREGESQVEAPEGRIVVTGTVIKRVTKFSDFDGGSYVKLTIKIKNADGQVWLLNVTEPSKVETERGDVVTLKATLTRSDNPEFFYFAFGKRPSNFEVLRHEELGEADALADPTEI